MISRRSFILVSAASGLFPFVTGEAYANNGQTEDGARAFIENVAEKVLVTFSGTTLTDSERQAKFRELLRLYIDLNHIALFVLGNYRRKATPEQISEFRAALEDNIVGTYSRRFANIPSADVAVNRVVEGKRKNWLVESVFSNRVANQSLNVQWRIKTVKDDWLIRDIQVQGLSMIVTQRDEYVGYIRSKGGNVDALIDALKKQNTKLLK